MSAADNPFLLHGGNVQIRVKHSDQQILGVVVSQAMVLASPVWKNFVISPGLGEKVEELDFTDDDGTALLILLRIVHLKFDEIPRRLRDTPQRYGSVRQV